MEHINWSRLLLVFGFALLPLTACGAPAVTELPPTTVAVAASATPPLPSPTALPPSDTPAPTVTPTDTPTQTFTPTATATITPTAILTDTPIRPTATRVPPTSTPLAQLHWTARPVPLNLACREHYEVDITNGYSAPMTFSVAGFTYTFGTYPPILQAICVNAGTYTWTASVAGYARLYAFGFAP